MDPIQFVENTKKNGVEIEVRGGILTLRKRFNAGDKNGFAGAETDCSVIYDAPQTQPGSTWGTTGDTVGGFSAIQSGCMVLNRSGVSKRWLTKLGKLL